jgi:hypothetical protein
MTAICRCGAPLVTVVEVWCDECQACSGPSLDLPYPRSTAGIATASVNGRARLERALARRELGASYIEDDVVDLDEPLLSTTREVQASLVEHLAILADSVPVAPGPIVDRCPTCNDPLEFVLPDRDDYCMNCGHQFDAAHVAAVRSRSTATTCSTCGAVLLGIYGPYVFHGETACWHCNTPLISKDAAREASFGYDPEFEIREECNDDARYEEPEPVKCVRCEEMVTQYDVNQHGQPLCFECCEDLERWDFR